MEKIFLLKLVNNESTTGQKMLKELEITNIEVKVINVPNSH